MEKKYIIAFIVLVIAAGAAFGGYRWNQAKETAAFKSDVTSIYHSYKALYDDGIKFKNTIDGRNFDNMFADLNSLKSKNQDLKVKAAALSPKNDESKEIHKELTNMISLFDDTISSMTSTVEKQRNMQIGSINADEKKHKDLQDEVNQAFAKYQTNAQSLFASQKTLESSIGVSPTSESMAFKKDTGDNKPKLDLKK